MKADSALCGAAGLIRHFDWPEMELGWRLFPPWQGRGLATEAARRICGFASEKLAASTLVSYIDAENEPSVRVAKRLGAVLDGAIVLRGDRSLVYRHPFPSN